ncbi:class I SAM-dependent methyltransferase [Agrobacterium vitis]|uniref:S-adenosyl-L-methionine-dependent methyltransferase n=1 Tax=Agrobacterium vitis TaxID=373 RepID=A0A7K1RFR4_AGRVI|nr:class I SAM-dependent methyltransferase [Agrobacterium vitis]MVA56846.1 SAM-dependent methyltransferase [Agrobacterium vitis]
MPSNSKNIIDSGQPSPSALTTASLRAAHELLDEPIVLTDPIALKILGPETEAALRQDPFRMNDPISRSSRAFLIGRSRFAEDELAHAVAQGICQYVILGAGLDTFAYRNPHAEIGVRVFELDHASTQQWKRECLEKAGIALPDSVSFVPVDFEHDTLAERLAEAGFHADQPACFCWMGVTVYLTRQAIIDTLSFVASQPAGSSITFDYRVPASHLGSIERFVVDIVEKEFTDAGEPWLSSFEPEQLQQQLKELGFSHVEDPGPEAINLRYFSRRKDGLQTGTLWRCVCARV